MCGARGRYGEITHLPLIGSGNPRRLSAPKSPRLVRFAACALLANGAAGKRPATSEPGAPGGTTAAVHEQRTLCSLLLGGTRLSTSPRQRLAAGGSHNCWATDWQSRHIHTKEMTSVVMHRMAVAGSYLPCVTKGSRVGR